MIAKNTKMNPKKDAFKTYADTYTSSALAFESFEAGWDAALKSIAPSDFEDTPFGMGAPRFKKRSFEVNAVQWLGTNLDEVVALCGGEEAAEETLKQALEGDWIIRLPNHTVAVMSPGKFAVEYTPTDELVPDTLRSYGRGVLDTADQLRKSLEDVTLPTEIVTKLQKALQEIEGPFKS
jgi:hypothetical protein